MKGGSYTFTRRGYFSGRDRIFVKRGYTFRVEGGIH